MIVIPMIQIILPRLALSINVFKNNDHLGNHISPPLLLKYESVSSATKSKLMKMTNYLLSPQNTSHLNVSLPNSFFPIPNADMVKRILRVMHNTRLSGFGLRLLPDYRSADFCTN